MFENENYHSHYLAAKRLRTKRLAVPMAVLALFMQAAPAFATIDNTVTVNATGPGGALAPVLATENVDVVDDNATLSLSKTHAFAPGGDLNSNTLYDSGDIVEYTYEITNTGNVTLRNVTVADVHQGLGAAPVMVTPVVVTTDAAPLLDSDDLPANADGDWETLAPGDTIRFTSTYTIVAGDISGAGGGDSDIDNTATATGDYDPGTGNIVASANDSDAVVLNIISNLVVTKVADDDTEVVAGQVVTYTYTVSNTGNVALTNVTLSDTHNGIPGALTPTFASWTTQNGSTVTGNTIDTFNPGAVAVFTAQYTVTQFDVDTRQ
jgi:uncharacterized repeat protein (TIGR01451 family)